MARDILASDDSDTEDINQLTINEHYAKAFEYKKEREELAKLKEKYGSDAEEDEEDDSEEAESEDEDGEELTPAVDAAILRTLARIKRKDPSIYEQEKDVFEGIPRLEEVQKTGDVKVLTKSRKKDKSKPLTIKQQNIQAALHPDSRSPSPQPMTHAQEQEALRDETIAAFHTAVDGTNGDEDDDLLVPREKATDELEREEEEYQEFLKREVGTDLKELITVDEGSSSLLSEEPEIDRETKKKKKIKKSEKTKKSKTEEDQEFLMNYILNRGWIDRSAKRLPTYSEITSSKTKKDKGKTRADSPMDEDEDAEEAQLSASENGLEEVEDEDEFNEIADRFESSYNFRFEEPGADQIPRYPRNIDSLVRRQDSTRKEERERRKARKEEEMLKKKEEVKRLKALKMKDIRQKLERIGKEGGKEVDKTGALQELDLEGDWDPEAHEAQMAKIYGSDDGGFVDEEKPTWDDDIDIGNIIPEEAESSSKKKKKKKKKADEREVDGVDVDDMDADVVRMIDGEEWDGTEEMRKAKLNEYMDELYELEFNDMVAGIPTRFKYAKVNQQSFALNPVEILLATDAELNQYMGLSKYAPYRKDSKSWDSQRGVRLKELKQKIGERSQALGAGEDLARVLPEKPAKKRKGKKERMREKATLEPEVGLEEVGEPEEETIQPQANGATKRKPSNEQPVAEGAAESSKRKRRRHKKAALAEDS
ncbi:hypothetical protein PHLGIDRAFT_12467 [Phlebiopsis gigantea 11061_1 CR5-6]|uniref:Kri1-like C-terminal domain-containing protein n=1 Tax=Phlebiopsis gigantea (strain 11061_1 CR5-6) TaxID=745531 RepID=A0A0C3S9X2_PHLG1|nr:hypothetical protein PHLGIDRAFT_12467 [Phlebiopsis gigantea 11061_1 CR5-6]